MPSTTGWALSGRAHISHSQKAQVLVLSFGLTSVNHYCIGHGNAEHSKRTEHENPPILVGCLASHDGFRALRTKGGGTSWGDCNMVASVRVSPFVYLSECVCEFA